MVDHASGGCNRRTEGAEWSNQMCDSDNVATRRNNASSKAAKGKNAHKTGNKSKMNDLSALKESFISNVF